jgi:hypothetical protein
MELKNYSCRTIKLINQCHLDEQVGQCEGGENL